MSKEIVDLDALSPEPVTIKFQGKEIKVNPPETKAIVKMMKAGSKLRGVNEGELSDSLEEDLETLKETVKDIVPELKGKEINFAQAMKLTTVIMNMAMPEDKKELEKQGVKVDTDPKAKAA